MAPLYSQTRAQSLCVLLANISTSSSEPKFSAAGSLSPETLNTISVLLPLPAYPFPPSQPDRCAQNMLIWSGCLSLLIHLIGLFSRLFYKPILHTQFWLLPVALVSAFLAPRKPRRDGDALQPSDFVESAEFVFFKVRYQLIRQQMLFMDEFQTSLFT